MEHVCLRGKMRSPAEVSYPSLHRAAVAAATHILLGLPIPSHVHKQVEHTKPTLYPSDRSLTRSRAKAPRRNVACWPVFHTTRTVHPSVLRTCCRTSVCPRQKLSATGYWILGISKVKRPRDHLQTGTTHDLEPPRSHFLWLSLTSR